MYETQQSPMNIQKLPLNLEEVELALKTLKSNKSAGPDRIPAGFLKFGGPLTTKCEHDIVLAIWNEEQLRSDCTLCLIHKKGDPTFCGNYRVFRNQKWCDHTLACFLFNLALEWVIRNSGINTKGTLFSKTVQLAYVDDIVIIARSKSALPEAGLGLKKSS
ncbi:hypothetical protein TNIN_421121 [Trichonephila inaurata madagascariensis]|uniref:Reverse transcriptase domain-containing protein n=1 Tax=Trichonephila inaurata madagascariensis TaxID=2747483 RepID=A0A8X6YTN8_9ARAC|nr:hypothetical protein TNIN_421121 [Trichonephila inaurata madagascariensis]